MKMLMTILMSGAIATALSLGALAEVKKKPVGATPVRSINGISKLSETECATAKGILWERTECASGMSCAVQDEDKKWHYLCITKQ